MPPESTKGKLRRKTSRRETEELRFDGGHAREIEQKRNSGQISCAECRRLKIKCDKQIPCQSCQRRGCAALCPNGSLSTGQGTRFVLAATEHLHRRITKMGERIRQLEDALGELQSQHSTEPHPLLREDLLGVNQKDDESLNSPDESGTPANPPEVLDTFGTLSITDHGISRFFGPTGGSECLLMSDKMHQQDGADSSTPDSSRDAETGPLPQELRFFSQAFPFTPMGPTAAARELIEGNLPSWERASYLTQTYCEQAGWLFHGVSKDQIVDELLPKYYSSGPPKATGEDKSSHELALLFLVFAIGALVDLKLDPANAEAEHYHQVARAAICLQPVLEKPSLVTIQALHMLSIYNAMSGNELSAKETSMETTWSLIVLAAHLSQTVGLHRDSTRWGLNEKTVQRRRTLFWDLFIADAWNCLNTGRPPSFSLAYIDCRFPGSENNSGEKSELHSEFESWGYRFAYECVAEVASRTLTAETPSYATIIELDRKVREFPVPDEATQLAVMAALPMSTITEDMTLPESMSRFVMSNAREVILLYLHRSFFAQAIIENPVNPLKSQYAPSFLATYRASSTILQTINSQYTLYPELCARFWSIWSYGFSAAIVFGTIVTRGPRSPLVSNAIRELDAACVLFTKAASQSRRAAKALPILTKLSEKAHNALAASQTEKLHGQLGLQWSVREDGDDDDDELAIFAGRTRFVSTMRLPGSSSIPTSSDGVRPSSESVPSGLAEPAPPPVLPHLYQPEGSVSSSSSSQAAIDQPHWTTVAPPPPPPPAPERDPLHYPTRSAEYANAGVPPPILPQWRPPRRLHYPYTPQHHPFSGSMESTAAQPSRQAHEQHPHSSYAWSSQPPPPPAPSSSSSSSQYNSSAGYPGPSTSNGHGHGQHGHAYHPAAYERPASLYPIPHLLSHPHSHLQSHQSHHPSHAPHHHSQSHSQPSQPPSQHPQPPPQLSTSTQVPAPAPAPPTELTELGLVSQESRLDERWTSFMRDSGYFEGFGYRGR